MRIDIEEKMYGHVLSLKDIHITFPEGQTTLIIGTSGAGKSTLIKCLIDETEYRGQITDCDSSSISYIPQFPALNRFATAYGTIYWSARFEDIFAPNSSIIAAAEEVVQEVGLSSVKNKRIKNLSGGQKQRISIAKELIRNKSIIIADEIDTGLDCGVARSLIQTLSEVTHNKNKTTIVISHNLSNIEMYDNVVVLVKDSYKVGRVVFMGKPHDMKAYFGVQDYVDVLTMLNSKDEGGDGLADQYVLKFTYKEG